MVQMNENQTELQPTVKSEKESLLKKFDIPINHLDFQYLKECNNSKEIERILLVLRSGEEGFYPDLMKFTEKRLFEVNPSSKLLRSSACVLSKADISNNEWNEISSDLQNWVDNVNKNDKELYSFQDIKSSNFVPIRESKTNKNNCKLTNKSSRIKSMDYEAWDKLDVDTEILKIDIKEEKMKQEAIKKIEQKEKLNEIVLDPDIMTKAELNHAALQAKNIGNECYKTGDYEEALQYYTNSLIFMPSSTVYNNRAITNIKLKNYKHAIEDCNEVLKTEVDNEKAHLRKSTAYKHLKQYDKAIEILENYLRVNPNSVEAQNLMQNLKKLSGKHKTGKTVRMKIQDHASENNMKNTETKKIQNSYNKEKEITDNVLIPIPSTSSFSGPYIKVANLPSNIAKKVTNTSKTPAKSDENVINLNEKQNIKASEPVKDVEYNNNSSNGHKTYKNFSPYEFLKEWQAIKNDESLKELEKLLRSLDPTHLSKVVGNKLDGEMFSMLLKCMALRFTYENDKIFIETILTELQKIPRFNIIMLLMDRNDKKNVNLLISRINNKILELVYTGNNRLLDK